MNSQEILDKLNPEQQLAAKQINGPVLVLAGAGTGKTRVITYRIAYMLASGILPENILGMTFTNKAAAEMRERLACLVEPDVAKKVVLGTFHSFCCRVLRSHIAELGYLRNFSIADEADQQGLFKQALGNSGYNKEQFSLNGAIALIGRWKNHLITFDKSLLLASNTFEKGAAKIYKEYQKLLLMQNLVDFDDLLLLTYQLFHDHNEILKKYQDKFRYLLVDEYQDTNTAQFEIIKLLAGEHKNLCVVGDDDQSIYSWRGAEVENILNFPNIFPNTKVIRLEQNYRSMTSILNAANQVISTTSAKRHCKHLWSDLGEGSLPAIVTVENAVKESDLIADIIIQLRAEKSCLKLSDFAVLYRSNQLSRQVELSLRKAGLAYQVYGGQQFYQRKEIKDAVAYLRLVTNPKDDQSLLRILSVPPRGVGEKVVEELKKRRLEQNVPMLQTLEDETFIAKLSKTAKNGVISFVSALKKARSELHNKGNLRIKILNYLNACGYLSGLQKIYKDLSDAQHRRDNIDEFLNSVAQFEERNGDSSLESFLESFALLEENDNDDKQNEEKDGVVLSTIHAAKGLEFPIVFIIAMERNIFPHERALAENSGDEELRLFYVALTRAKEKLFLLRTRNRLHQGMNKPAQASPFLTLLGDTAEKKSPDDILKKADTSEMLQAFRDFYATLNKMNN